MDRSQTAQRLIESWWNALAPVKSNNGLPAKGTVAGALVVLERLKADYTLDLNRHRAKKGQSQIKGAGKAQTQKILNQFGETRLFVGEGGRTNRGLAGDIASLLEALRQANLEPLPLEERAQILTQLQIFLIGKVGEYFNRERLKFVYNPSLSVWQNIHGLLQDARANGKEGQVAQYMIGAKLTLRFPDFDIRNDSYSASDAPSGSPGDFLIGDTAFHVTIAPNQGHYEKCKSNTDAGFHVYLLAPERISTGVRQYAENFLPGRITVHSVESFVAQNLDELSFFSKEKRDSEFHRLLTIYNHRVDQVEADKSLLIEIPRNLVPKI